jgi:hypothetical protein
LRRTPRPCCLQCPRQRLRARCAPRALILAMGLRRVSGTLPELPAYRIPIPARAATAKHRGHIRRQ